MKFQSGLLPGCIAMGKRMSIRHPAKYTDLFIPVFADILKNCKSVLDPFAGTGKLALIKEHGFSGLVTCCELEMEWASHFDKVDRWVFGDSSNLPFSDGEFDGICTSPTYGNRMADHFNARDNSRRNTYRHTLGKELHKRNTGRMQWGDKYKSIHTDVYIECSRVLKVDGLFVLNISNHIRKGIEVDVTGWHIQKLTDIGLMLVDKQEIETPRLKYGSNRARVNFENIITFYKH